MTARRYYFGDMKTEMAGMLSDSDIAQVIKTVSGGDMSSVVGTGSRPLSQREMDEALASIRSGNDNIVALDGNIAEAMGHVPSHRKTMPSLDL